MGHVVALSTAPSAGAALVGHDQVELVGGARGGIAGDRHLGRRRAVTIVCTGELTAAAVDFGVESIDAASTRRNIVVDLDELPRTHGARIKIGATTLAVWRDCAPCSVMDDVFGDGAQDALRRRCGISASVIDGGVIQVGDIITIG